MIEQIVTRALHGDTGPRWSVVGTDPRGESFVIDGYRSRYDAADFAAEVNAKGGSAKVRKAVA